MLLCKTKGSREDTIEIVDDERGSIKVGGYKCIHLCVYIFLVWVWWSTLYSVNVKDGG